MGRCALYFSLYLLVRAELWCIYITVKAKKSSCPCARPGKYFLYNTPRSEILPVGRVLIVAAAHENADSFCHSAYIYIYRL